MLINYNNVKQFTAVSLNIVVHFNFGFFKINKFIPEWNFHKFPNSKNCKKTPGTPPSGKHNGFISFYLIQ